MSPRRGAISRQGSPYTMLHRGWAQIMTLEDLCELYSSMPPGSMIALRRAEIGELLTALRPAAEGRSADLTLPEVAERVGRALSTVRGWCNRGLLAGAYRLNGREWRVPPLALDAFLEEQRNGRRASRQKRQPTNLSAWRSEFRTDAQDV